VISRRETILGIAAAAACSPTIAETIAKDDGGPIFFPLGPDAQHYGADQGFPIGRQFDEPLNRVGAFSHFDTLFPTRRVSRAAATWSFQRAPTDIEYSHQGTRYSITDYLTRNPVTGLLIAKGNNILCEYYQYGRTDRDRLMSQSMAKSIVGMLVGIAIADGVISSVDDTAEKYVPGFKGSEYSKTSIRALLHMSSGVEFGEEADNQRDLDRLWFDRMGGYLDQYKGMTKGTIDGIV
jgi:hypothetical protein